MPATAGGRTGQFLGPPAKLGGGHLRFADAVSGAQQLLLKRGHGHVSRVAATVDEGQRHALLRLRGQPFVDEALQHRVLSAQLAHAVADSSCNNAASAAGESSTASAPQACGSPPSR